MLSARVTGNSHFENTNPHAKQENPETSRSVKCLILHTQTQWALKLALPTLIGSNYNDGQFANVHATIEVLVLKSLQCHR